MRDRVRISLEQVGSRVSLIFDCVSEKRAVELYDEIGERSRSRDGARLLLKPRRGPPLRLAGEEE